MGKISKNLAKSTKTANNIPEIAVVMLNTIKIFPNVLSKR